ncbi:MAG: glycosyltransferase, partial [Planctomycetes bacterium]|nr:glycosyltransferase [Planctomycetota bacterium]
MPKLSVIIPVAQLSRTLDETLSGVLGQSFADYELIVAGSEGHASLSATASRDDRIRHLILDGGTFQSLCNEALAGASGSYIAIIDPEYTYDRDYLRTMMAALEDADGYDAAYVPMAAEPDPGSTSKEPSCKSGWDGETVLGSSDISCRAMVARADVLRGHYFDENLDNAADYDFILRLGRPAGFLSVPSEGIVRRRSSAPSPDPAQWASQQTDRIRVAERFLYRLGGHKIVGRSSGKRFLAGACVELAEYYRREKCYKAEFCMYKQAIRYNPSAAALYPRWLKAYFSGGNNSRIEWQKPHKLGRPSGRRRHRRNTKHSLVLHVGHGYGDNIMASAVIEGIRRQYPKMRICMLTRRDGVFLNNPHISSCFDPYIVRKRNPALYDKAVCLSEYSYAEIKARQTPRHLIDLMYDSIPIDIRDRCYKPRMYLTDRELSYKSRRLKQCQRPLVAITPFGGPKHKPIRNKVYPFEQWQQVVRLLIEQGVSVVQLGAKNEGPLLAGVLDYRNLGYRRTAAVLARCDTLITHVSGLMHLAAAV